ncbi:MAG: hypothetical protein K8R23_01770 [Chthoniobacter sp.]|nr:hypothetical protein [Chthoniobacter sp.]
MKTTAPFRTLSFAACAIVWTMSAHAADVDAAIKSGNFAGYLNEVTASLKAQAGGKTDEAALGALLKDPAFSKTLDQRQLISKVGADKLAAFAKADPANATFLSWLLNSTEAMDQYLEAHVPIHLAAREQNSYSISAGPLESWRKLVAADPDAKTGIPMKIAIATAIRPPGSGAPGAGQAVKQSDPSVRYAYFKTAQKNKELFPSFDALTAWDMQYVVSSGASEEDLTWGREMINTWRPDLRTNELVVNSTSEVWRRNSPIDFANTFKNVLTGGGKCGPRSSWSVFICQAFGIPAIGVGQPAHACVAYKTAYPMTEPQPGFSWKVGYGRGWPFSKLEGMGGVDFIEGVQQRENRAAFSRVEHLRWLAAAVGGSEQTALMAVVHTLQEAAKAAKTDLTASHNADEAEKELKPDAAKAAVTAETKGPIKLAGAPIPATAFSSMLAVNVLNSFRGGKQVNFGKSIDSSWLEYTVEVPADGLYTLQIKAATPNDGQFFNVNAGAETPVNVPVPNTHGIWGMTPPVELKLQKGTQTLKIAAPNQRGVAVQQLELKAKG